jgi:hemerythrin superfamily protein
VQALSDIPIRRAYVAVPDGGLTLRVRDIPQLTGAEIMATHAKGRAGNDAIAMLTADHKKVKAMFKEFKSLKEEGTHEEKAALVKQICDALTVHAVIEEEIFYPAVRAAIEDGDLMDEALVEHAGAKEMIAQLRQMDPDDDLYDAKVTVLGEQINHHVEEEEGEMFPKAKKAKVDTEELGTELAARKQEKAAELGADLEGHKAPRKGSSRAEVHR